jgi:hypothetical protein
MTDAGQYCVRFGDATGKEGTPKLESLAQHGLPMTQTGTAGDDVSMTGAMLASLPRCLSSPLSPRCLRKVGQNAV